MSQVLPYLGVPPTAYIADSDAWNTAPQTDPNGDNAALDDNEDQAALTADVDDEAEDASPVTYIQDDVEEEDE